MAIMKLLVFMLPVIANAKITINIQAYKDTKDASLESIGTSQSIITTDEQKIFHLTEETLKNAVHSLTKRTPTNVYLHGPTPWNDLYKTYGWQPVKTIIKPYKIRVVDVDTSEVVLNKRTITNEGTLEKNEEVSMKAKVDNKVACFWKQDDAFSANIDYNINIVVGATSFKLNSTFGQNIKDNKIVDVKSPSVQFVLKPKQAANLVFKGTKVKLTVEIEYWVMLKGNMVTNNEVKLDGHHFWAYDIKRIMKAASLHDLRKTKEVITVEYYTDTRIVVS